MVSANTIRDDWIRVGGGGGGGRVYKLKKKERGAVERRDIDECVVP